MSDESGNPPAPEPAANTRRQGRGVLCRKCEHLNPTGLDACEYCEEPLFLNCPSCNAVNPRVLSRCCECRTPLETTFRDRLRKAPATEESKGGKVREPANVTKAGRGILCAKCEHLNPDGREDCEHCDSPLFVNCPKCSVRNVRALGKCSECRSTLHRSLKERLWGGSDAADSKSGKLREAAKVSSSGRGVLCAKCEHLNPTGIERCEHCDASLFLLCPSCSTRNVRALANCAACREPLHQTAKKRFLGGSGADESKPGKVREPANVTTAGRGVLCARCEHLNPAGIERCEHCESLLFINCPGCSTRNVRALGKCSECRAPLFRSLKERLLGSETDPKDSGRGGGRVPAEAPENGKGVLCAKCDHLNPAGEKLCEYCQGHLYVLCRDCGHTNARVLPRCEKCDRRLHRSFKDRMRGGNESKPLNLLYAGVAFLAIAIALFVLVKMSGLRLFK